MKITYRVSKQDYLNSVTLKQTINRQGMLIMRLIGLLAVASGVYLSAAALTGTTGTEHPVPYVIAIIAAIFFLITTDSRILPAILFNSKLRSKEIPDGLIGVHELELLPNYLEIRYGGYRFRFRYPAVAGITTHKQLLMLFTTTGLVEMVPSEAFLWGVTKQDFLEKLDERIKTFEDQKIDTPIKGFTDFDRMNTAEQATVTFTTDDVLHSSLVHSRQAPRKNLRDGVMLVWLVMAVFVLVGSIKGLIDYAMNRVELPSFMIIISYIFCLIVAAFGIIRIWPPAALAQRAAKKAIASRQYPEGYIGQRDIRWNAEGVQYAYGYISGCLTWQTLSTVIEDDQGFYLYQGSNMVIAIPSQSLTERQLSSFKKAAGAVGR